MSQLDEFREQLRQRPKLNEPEREKTPAVEPTATKKVRKKKSETKAGYSSVWLSKETQRKAKLLLLWLEAEDIEGPGTIGAVLADALDSLIDIKYPKAKKYVDRG